MFKPPHSVYRIVKISMASRFHTPVDPSVRPTVCNATNKAYSSFIINIGILIQISSERVAVLYKKMKQLFHFKQLFQNLDRI